MLLYLVKDSEPIYFRPESQGLGPEIPYNRPARPWGRIRPELIGGQVMARTVLSIVAGFIAWWIVVSIIDITMRYVWPDYAANFAALTFNLPMKLARLAESTVALVAAALVTARIAPDTRWAPWALGIVLLLFFIPVHYWLWDKFPVWYHAYFLTSLIVVPALVARAGMRSATT